MVIATVTVAAVSLTSAAWTDSAVATGTRQIKKELDTAGQTNIQVSILCSIRVTTGRKTTDTLNVQPSFGACDDPSKHEERVTFHSI